MWKPYALLPPCLIRQQQDNSRFGSPPRGAFQQSAKIFGRERKIVSASMPVGSRCGFLNGRTRGIEGIEVCGLGRTPRDRTAKGCFLDQKPDLEHTIISDKADTFSRLVETPASVWKGKGHCFDPLLSASHARNPGAAHSAGGKPVRQARDLSQ
ncbi:hypothetical protein JOH51_004339 [Rhizobium leguminosarum]|nr:hypothetical protein [Rhizobium leguminosarum]